MGLCDAVCGSLRWWRRLRGGHWEGWHVDSPVNAFCWLRLDECLLPGWGLLRGTPQREDW
jgi:hypothetical protein